MALTLPPDVAAKAGLVEAPGNKLGAQDPAAMVAKDRKQPGVKKPKGPGKRVYPNLPSNEDTDDGEA